MTFSRLLALGLCIAATSCDTSGQPSSDASRPDLAGAAKDPMTQRRLKMVEQLEASGVEDPRVLDAMARVPRHEFVDDIYRSRTYELSPLPIGEDQTISSPDVVGIMTQALELEGDEKVLEIGTGSGYQAAVLGEIVDEVYSIEIRPALARSARRRLQDLKERGLLSYKKIEVIEGDGYRGYPEEQPYDAIIVTAAPKKMVVPLINQLKIGGRMVIPVGEFYQELQVVTKVAEGQFEEKSILPVRFVPMVHEPDVAGGDDS